MEEIKQNDIEKINAEIHKEITIIDLLNLELNKVIVGQKKLTSY